MAVPTRIELAISTVTVWHVNRYTTGPLFTPQPDFEPDSPNKLACSPYCTTGEIYLQFLHQLLFEGKYPKIVKQVQTLLKIKIYNVVKGRCHFFIFYLYLFYKYIISYIFIKIKYKTHFFLQKSLAVIE